MKKVLIGITFAAMALVSQAATISWTSGTVYLPTSDSSWSGTKAGSGAVAAYYFVVDAATYNGFDAATAVSDRFDVNATTGAVTLKDGVSASYNRTTTGGGAANWANQTINEGQTIYALAVYTYTDTAANKGYYIANKGYVTMASGATEPTGAYTNLASGIGAWTAFSSSTPDPIPEPTTVALLALGLAAVGLKRKVA
ncbi:MAG: PEP-CTERM sorting domain-containing protein [Kiritimatiellae bacterium]|nr:PEP-CTERM sorting domain-containing protein [Kiritimatiellia bacterium]